MDGDFIGPMCITRWVIKMNDKKTRLNCRLITRGTKNVENQVEDDLSTQDPDESDGKRLIEDELNTSEAKEKENGC